MSAPRALEPDEIRKWPGLREALGWSAPLLEGSTTTTFVARAPGRLDGMGGIADYSGSLVLELPLREATVAVLETVESRQLVLESASDHARVALSLDELLSMSYAEARGFFASDPSRSWAAYVAGSFLVLAREKESRFPHGARLFLYSDVPEGKGVASSAALEVAAMTALSAAYGADLEPRELATLCQKVENDVVGAPCGIMDQMTSVYSEADRLLALLCQPAEIQSQVAVPGDLSFWGIDSGIRHAVSGSDYASVRVGAFMGLALLRELSGRSYEHLVHVSPSDFSAYRGRLPETMSGAEFLEAHGPWIDEATTVDPEATYGVRSAAAHPIEEHRRIQTFAELLEQEPLASAEKLGALMYESHESYSACGLGSPGTDRLVALARDVGVERGVYGAKITGGGSGGTVAILARRDASEVVEEIARRYGEEAGASARLFAGSSSGSLRFGTRLFRS
jgi:galactokinase